jgi:hypothetical protein
MDESEMNGSNALGALTLEMDLGEDESGAETSTTAQEGSPLEPQVSPSADA